MTETPLSAVAPVAYEQLTTIAATAGVDAMFTTLATMLKERKRWHALFDTRLLQARFALGIAMVGDVAQIDPAKRLLLDERSLEACREVGWPLVEEGHVAAGWMYLRAAAEPEEMAQSLATLAARLDKQPSAAEPENDEAASQTLQEIITVALWEGVHPALGLSLLLAHNGTCNGITAYEQAISRLPMLRQQPAADVLVDHLYGEISVALAADLLQRGTVLPAPTSHSSTPGDASIAALLEAAGGMADDPAIHVDVSHLQSVLRLARVCTKLASIQKAWQLAHYACRLPAEAVYPGEAPFANVAESSKLFYGAQLGFDVEKAIRFFRSAAATARLEDSGTLPADTLVLLLWRIGRPTEALHAALERPNDASMASSMQATGMLPSLVELAAIGPDWEMLRAACRARGDEITFAVTLAIEHANG